MFEQFLAQSDTNRALRTFQKLANHDISRWALTGGLATEIHCLRRGCRPAVRSLNDIDFVADSFACLPDSLANDFLFRHIHPEDPPNKTMLQAIDPRSALRVDVFRACGTTMRRTCTVDLPTGSVLLISLEDLIARMARLAMNIVEDLPTESVHARDYLRLAEFVDPVDVELAWRDHRKPAHPESFEETNALLQSVIPARQHMLVARNYSHDLDRICPRCRATAGFTLADPKVIFEILGYV
jgi:hypothetical protein